MTRPVRLTSIVFFLAALGGAARADQGAVRGAGSTPGPYPGAYDMIVRDYLAENLKDPASAIIEETRGPREGYYRPSAGAFGLLGFSFQNYGTWRVCYRINAKNSYGGYTGKELYAFYIQNGRIVDEEVDNAAASRECALPADPAPAGPKIL